MEMIDNKIRTLAEDLQREIKPGSKVAIIAERFSFYAFQVLEEKLKNISELRFILTSPTFNDKKEIAKDKREFYIPKLERENSLYGTDFEVRMRNDMRQKVVARECASWIKAKVHFRENVSTNNISQSIIIVDDIVYVLQNRDFTTETLGVKSGKSLLNTVIKFTKDESVTLKIMFEQLWNDQSKLQDVTEVVLKRCSSAYKENAPEFLYYATLNKIFPDAQEITTIANSADDKTGFKNSVIWNKLYKFQKEAALVIINRLETLNGCVLADSVGLGKTFTALAVIKYYESCRKKVLVLCPKKLSENWNLYVNNVHANILLDDNLHYDVLYHTDLSRKKGFSGNIDLAQVVWGNYDLVVIDESHNFRNGGKNYWVQDEIEEKKNDIVLCTEEIEENQKYLDDNKNSITEEEREEIELEIECRQDEIGVLESTIEALKDRLKHAKFNRYDYLMMNVLRSGRKTKVLLLSATPVNNQFVDLQNQLDLIYEGHPEELENKLNIENISSLFSGAQRAFKEWGKLPLIERTTDELLKRLDLNFFKLLGSISIARSRKQIEKFYSEAEIGKFPTRLKPIDIHSAISKSGRVGKFEDVFKKYMELNLQVYTPSQFVMENFAKHYVGTGKTGDDNEKDDFGGVAQLGRETGLKQLMAINLLKRMESSADSFKKTLKKIHANVCAAITKVDEFDAYLNEHPDLQAKWQKENAKWEEQRQLREEYLHQMQLFKEGILPEEPNWDDFMLDKDLQEFAANVDFGNTEFIVEQPEVGEEDVDDVFEDSEEKDAFEGFVFGNKNKVSILNIAYPSWKKALESDKKVFEELIAMMEQVDESDDAKLKHLYDLIDAKIANPTNPGNKKMLIFTAFATTADYLYEHVSKYVKMRYGLNTALVTGKTNGKSTIAGLHCDFNTVLTLFSPISKDKNITMPDTDGEIDILIATDCISEGQNLQDCDWVVNYDIHWNPVRIIQRFGRIDRIGSKNDKIQLVNLWPDMELNEYLSLQDKVENRMKIVDMVATGDYNILDPDQQNDVAFREQQIEAMKDEVLDLEDLRGEISITDLGLNTFKQKLIEYAKGHPNLDTVPMGLNAVVPADDLAAPGVIYVLKNVKNVNADKRNALNPFFTVYIGMDGKVLFNHWRSKELLDVLNHLCDNKPQPLMNLCNAVNAETKDGIDMQFYSDLLSKAIGSIVEQKSGGDTADIFSGKIGSLVDSTIEGIDDFELISFFIVK